MVVLSPFSPSSRHGKTKQLFLLQEITGFRSTQRESAPPDFEERQQHSSRLQRPRLLHGGEETGAQRSKLTLTCPLLNCWQRRFHTSPIGRSLRRARGKAAAKGFGEACAGRNRPRHNRISIVTQRDAVLRRVDNLRNFGTWALGLRERLVWIWGIRGHRGSRGYGIKQGDFWLSIVAHLFNAEEQR